MPTDPSPQAVTPAPTVVARGTVTDAEAKPFLRRCFAAAYPAFATPDMLAHVEDVQTTDILANEVEDRILIAARQEGRLVGLGVGVLRHRTLYAWGLYVDPALHRSGLGTRIMAALCADLADDIMVEVQVYSESNDARAFYTALGFQTTDHTQAELFPGHICTLAILSAERSALRI
ncbi:GNAT family N-acetyltransferase [Tateyamaria omphalii]|uniref:N-acetyltransferase domain-containing protein n=1 Tax=Tateyamaria omphalii TaxID=299262 RepID=A0A1P8MTJ0_9RHOB|nr:GNAT family N-acetyltransferase [Tateyamaria omphalii]APX11355.1 hypothetical protein BWR18_06430 [Tateyamaria omphalii]